MHTTLSARPRRAGSFARRRGAIEVSISSLGRNVPATLLGLSCGGAQVRSEALFPAGTWANVTFRCGRTGLTCHVEAMIRTARPEERGEDQQGGWLLGLSFRERLVERQFAEFRQAGAPDRRVWQRMPMRAQTTARFGGATEGVPIELLDLSDGGCRIAAEMEFHVGCQAQVQLWPNMPPLPPAEVVWTEQIEGRNVAGCRFI